jgi:hypothetical protein
MDLTPNHKLKDLVQVIKNPEMGVPMDQWRKAQFPEILKDEYGNYIGIVSLSGERIDDPMVAFLIDLMKWGYDNLESYSALKAPTERVDTPEPSQLPHEIRKNFQTTKAIRDYFEFRDELPPGVKRWTPKTKMVRSKVLFHLPTLCIGPRGYREAFPGGSGFDAACIAAIQAGLSIRHWDNGIPNFHVDDTAQRLAFLKGRMSAPDFPTIVEDSKWQMLSTSIPHRGIRDYDRRIVFSAPLTDEQLAVFQEYLSLDDCPGWTGVGMRQEGRAYVFGTTHDSSD